MLADVLVWPPTKEDLERLYLVERLSASKIAKAYGLKYKNAKVAESTVFYQLKRNGIDRRGCADHVRKVTEAMVDEWIARYQAGESLKQIAGEELSPVTVFLHLRKRGLKLSDKVEAQIQAVTKHERRPFVGDESERAYLMGLRYGDLHVVRHGRAIRARVSTTHPAMADLFENLFSPYGHVARYPRKASLTGYEWTLECDLDNSFGFLLEKPNVSELEKLGKAEFLAFLAGFFDAEGTIYLHVKSSGTFPELSLTNTDINLLELIHRSLTAMGFQPAISYKKQAADRFPGAQSGGIWKLGIWRIADVRRLLPMLAFKHEEKVNKARLAQSFLSSGLEACEFEDSWANQIDAIERGRNAFVNRAKTMVESSPSSESKGQPVPADSI